MEYDPNTNTISATPEGVNIIIVNPKPTQTILPTEDPSLIEEKFNQFTSSIQTMLADLNTATGSYIVELPPNLISGSEQITSLGFITECVDLTHLNQFTESIQISIANLTNTTGSYLTHLPNNIISSSEQITNLGFITECVNLTSLNQFTESIQTQVNAINNSSNSYLTQLPTGLISSSEQISLLGYTTNVPNLASLNTFTSSFTTITENIILQLQELQSQSSTYLTGSLTVNDIANFNEEVLNILNNFNFNITSSVTTPPPPSSTFEGNTINAETGSFNYLEVDKFSNKGTGIPTISSPTNLNLEAINSVIINDLLQLKGTTVESVINPVNGSIIYDENQHKFFGYANGTWVAFN